MTQTARQRLEDELATLEQAPAGSATDGARAQELRRLLRTVEVDRKPDDGLVEPGMQVTVRFGQDSDQVTFLVGDREMMGLDPDLDLDVYSPTSPMGAAITGKSVGDTVSYQAPNGEQQVTIVQAQPFG
ncbi:GreA/GreB family elongation factor [Microlunatus soli]|uniref:Transcription elongation factor, GreA/GreB, C-term n=1 Tax=Microlunatus soli TaxID=630515 RepID=A0A1H1RFV9_9ACTN|nr:GreA/GreB family elongation factor [Microlunatus soli]SDS34553.1 Transcription elongation factor, GreA/GreB, C-term [Microlunatus soli]